jgi:uncharacterized glyoxalase superfamily protein PhnB
MTAEFSPVRKRPETLRLRDVTPALTVNDLTASLRFYIEGLGFVADERWEEGGQLRGVVLKAGTGHLLLTQDDFAKGRDRAKGVGMRLRLTTVQDLDALATRLKGLGITLDHEPRVMHSGARGFGLTDPDGFKLTVTNLP